MSNLQGIINLGGGGEVLNLMDKHAIIKLKREGKSNREVSRLLGINRKTVAIYWNKQLEYEDELGSTESLKSVQNKMVTNPKYDSSKRKARKYNSRIDKLLDDILDNEVEKCKELGWHKQQLTSTQIFELIKAAGHDIGLSTISYKINEKRNKVKECFIKQSYDLGERLEYDFGEVRLEIGGVLERYHIAVFSSPKSGFRWAYLYKNQKKQVFLDSHVKFFEMLGGVHKEIVYDNMKNVVNKFIGKNVKQLNDDLLKLSIYYGFDINVTNCYKGNEKGHVENSVKVIRNKVFGMKYKFISLIDAEVYLKSKLIELNKDSLINDEIEHLQKAKPKLDLARYVISKVNKYSCITIDNNYYSVPDYLVGRTVEARIYYDSIEIYSNDAFVYQHQKVDGFKEYSINIMHYLNTFVNKPGALKNSLALKSSDSLKNIYTNHYKESTREFIEFLQKNNKLSLEEIVTALEESKGIIIDKNLTQSNTNDLENVTRNQINKYNQLVC
ncbi:IS21 family transposase [Mycoplasmatota bacterium zrk1]